jgi:hypothetical protein
MRFQNRCTQGIGGAIFPLNTLAVARDDAFKDQAKDVLKYWLDVEEQNLRRVKSRILGCSMPYKYKTNEKGDGGIVSHRIAYPSAEDTKQAIRSFEVQLGWIAETLFRNGNIRGSSPNDIIA